MSYKTQPGAPRERSLVGIVARVRETIERYALVVPGDRVVVACSGGPDSVALVALLQRCDMALDLVVAHVDHGLRPDSAQDSAAVADLARSLGLIFVQRTLALAPEGPEGQPEPRVSEDTARRARLAALESLADEAGAVRVALGHTADDQLETLLMRLCRGAGLTGLAGMAPRRGRLVRPLLELDRQDVLATLEEVGWTAREDPTNRSRRYLRNRVRWDVVPLLDQENPRLLEAVTRSTRGMREELEALRFYEDWEWRRLAAADPLEDALDVAGLAALPLGMASRLVRRLWRSARGRLYEADGSAAELSRAHVEAVLGLVTRDTGPRLDLPGGVVAYRQYDLLVVAPAADLADPGDVAVQVEHPGVYPLPGLGLLVEAEAEPAVTTECPWCLTVRNSRAGDRLRGPAGSRKLSDTLVDRKVPRARRRRLALVLWQGEILWIPGVWHRDGMVVPAGDRSAVLSGPGVCLSFREARQEKT